MYTIALYFAILGAASPAMLLASEESPAQAPSVSERMRHALSSEGGVQVYKDNEGNVETILDPPGGDPHTTVQPPQSPSMNLGPPLQLNNPPFQLPPAMSPMHPSSPDFPRKAR